MARLKLENGLLAELKQLQLHRRKLGGLAPLHFFKSFSRNLRLFIRENYKM
jgi:hypothetical protein